jgi:hypothetical protein
VVYTGDVPAVGAFGRALVVPEPLAILGWDGRVASPDEIKAGQEQEPRRVSFLVPRDLRGGILVLAGDVDAQYWIENLGIPAI